MQPANPSAAARMTDIRQKASNNSARAQRLDSAGAVDRATPGLDQSIAGSSASRFASAAPFARVLPVGHSRRRPRLWLAAWRRYSSKGRSRHVICPTLAAHKASHQSCEATTLGIGSAISRSARLDGCCTSKMKLRPSRVFSGRPDPTAADFDGETTDAPIVASHPPRSHRRSPLWHLAPRTSLRRLQCLQLASNFVGMPDVVLVGQQNVIGPAVPCLLQEVEKFPRCPVAAYRRGPA